MLTRVKSLDNYVLLQLTGELFCRVVPFFASCLNSHNYNNNRNYKSSSHRHPHPQSRVKFSLSVVQCNILFSARRHKLQLFTGFRRRAVVVFPSADEWRRRLSQHQTSDGDQIPETALLKLQGLTYISVIWKDDTIISSFNQKGISFRDGSF